MLRLLAIATLTFLPAALTLAQVGAEKDLNVKGTFTKDDPRDATRKGPSQVHTFAMKAGKVYVIDMVSSDFDSYLRLLDPKGNQLDGDDDSGGNLNARIVFNCNKDGDYKILCTTFGAEAKGSYQLTVKTTGSVQKPSTGHTQLIGKPAPDLASDYAINGKAGKLSDLKGKVVLLNFWDLRTSSSVALLPKLAEWHKTHKDAGLVIVGVSFYMHEIGQRLAFDEKTNGIVTAKQADRATDQALFTAFAKHHKLEYPLWSIPKQDAFAAYDNYVVNGTPQLVLIDRQGVVRMIDINGDKGSAGVETEMKKLLGEK